MQNQMSLGVLALLSVFATPSFAAEPAAPATQTQATQAEPQATPTQTPAPATETQPAATPKSAPAPAASKPATSRASANSVADDPDFIRAAKSYNKVEKDGKILYCRRDASMGTRLPTTKCLTAEQLLTQAKQNADVTRRMGLPKSSPCGSTATGCN